MEGPGSYRGEPGGEEKFWQLLKEAYQRKYLRHKTTFGKKVAFSVK